MPADPTRARELFLAAAELAPDRRTAFLAEACGPDADLRAEVSRLLAARGDPTGLPETPLDGTGPFVPEEDRETATVGGNRPAGETGAPTAGQVIAGRYTLVRVIGEGGMGSVYLASQTEPVKRQVALKLIKAGMDSKAVLARFEAERQALALMDHPNIARVYDGGTTASGQPFFVMEFVQGVPLTEYFDRARLPVAARLELFVAVCQAVQHAHQKGIIHRDLKPSNILVESHDGKPVPKVIDFGLAKATGGMNLGEQSLFTGFGGVMGTPLYMAPEQASFNALDVDTRADIYALGVILYELLTGTTPLTREALKKAAYDEGLRLIREQEAPPPSSRLGSSDAAPAAAVNRQTEPAKLARLVRGELDWIVMKALDKDRNRRYETANGFARDVERFLRHEPVTAGPPGRGYRLRKFVRRNRIEVTAAGLVLLALLAGIVGTTLGLLEARRQEGFARTESAAKEAALQAEQQQREEAQANASLAERVLDTMTSELTEKALITQQAVTADQKMFLLEALKYYREFAAKNADGEAARMRVATAAHRVAVIEMRLNRNAEAASALRTASELFGQLAADYPNNPVYRASQGATRHNLAHRLSELGKRAEAADEYRAALAVREKLAEDFPNNPEYREAVAATRLNMANIGEGKGGLADVLAIQEALVRDFPDNPRYRDALAAARANLALELLRQGKPGEALVEGRKALVIQEKLVEDFPAERDYRQRLYRTHQYLAATHARRQDPAESEAHYRKALAIQLKLAADFPAVPQYRQELAVTRVNLGNELINQRKLKEGEEQYREAADLLEKLVSEAPAELVYRQQLLSTYVNLGIILGAAGQSAEVERVTRAALRHQEKLAAATPAGGRPHFDFARACADFANRLRGGGKADESLEWFGKAVAAAGGAHRSNPSDAAVKQLLRDSHGGRAVTLAELTRFADALPDWEKALELSPPEQRPAPRAGRALALAHLGRAADAVAEAAGLEKATDFDAGQWYDLACVYSLAAAKLPEKRGEYAGRAIGLLRTAVKAGFKDAARVRTANALDPLRDRDDFKTLLAEFEK